MLKKTISYTDYDGNERTEDFYFNLSKAEIIEMELGTAGGMKKCWNASWLPRMESGSWKRSARSS